MLTMAAMSDIYNPMATNIQKYENYREQFNRLKRALASEFYLEAIFIEYAIENGIKFEGI